MDGDEEADLGSVVRAPNAGTAGFDTEHTGPAKQAGFCVL
jgi:hypothetical protein